VSDLPFILRSLSLEELRLLANAKEGDALFNIPVDSRAEDRVVVDVTEASKHGCEATARNDFIRAHVPGYHIQPEFKTEFHASYRGMVLHLHEIIC